MKPTTDHGGQRKGAGRPITGKPRRIKLAITLDPAVLAYVDSVAERSGCSRSAALEAMARHCWPSPSRATA